MNSKWYWNEAAIDRIDWDAWDAVVSATGRPSVFLDSRMIRSLLVSSERRVAAVIWEGGNHYLGIALVEDTVAQSVRLEDHLEAKTTLFGVVNRILHARNRTFRFSVRVVGPVLGSGDHAFRLRPGISEVDWRKSLDEILFTERKDGNHRIPKVAMMKDFRLDLANEGSYQTAAGWTALEFDPEMIISMQSEWRDLDDYLGMMKTKSRTKIRRILKISEMLEVLPMSFGELQDEVNVLISLYQQVFERSGFRLGSLHASELLASKEHWGSDFQVLKFMLDGRLVGFQCAYVTENATEAFFVGFIPELNKSHAIYQRMLIEFIRIGLQAGSREIHLGRTALDIKSSVGAHAERLRCEVRFKNPWIHRLAHWFTQGYKPVLPSLKKPWKESKIDIVTSASSGTAI